MVGNLLYDHLTRIIIVTLNCGVFVQVCFAANAYIVMEKSEVRADRISFPPSHTHTHMAREINNNDDSDTRDYLGTVTAFFIAMTSRCNPVFRSSMSVASFTQRTS